MTELAHGYSRYAYGGCRCEVCRAAKAEYMRGRRALAAETRRVSAKRGQRYVVAGISHGRNGHRDHSCRCEVCRAAEAARARRQRRRRLSPA